MTARSRHASRPEVRVLRGPRAAQAALLAEVEALLAPLRDDPSQLAVPVRIVVPSDSLRLHVAASLVRHLDRGRAGVVIQTHFGLALEILDRADARRPSAEAILPALVRQHARRQPALRETLDDLLDGYSVVEAAVSDLLDAGLEAEHAPQLETHLNRSAQRGLGVENARAVVCVALDTLASLEEKGLDHRSALLHRARQLLDKDPAVHLPARAVLVHGFAEATGRVAQLIETLVVRHRAIVLLDEPLRPGALDRPDTGVAFVRRLRRRIEAHARVREVEGDSGDPPSLVALRAPGAQAEARAIAVRVRALLNRGVAPERIAVVARELAPYAAFLRIHFGRLGVPFSGIGPMGLGGPRRRRIDGLLELLRARDSSLSEAWLDVLIRLPVDPGRELARPLTGVERADLRVGLRVLAAGRLSEVAQLEPAEQDLPLPVRTALRLADPGGEAAEVGNAGEEFEADADTAPDARARRRRLAASLLNATLRAARAVLRRCESWPEPVPMADHLAALRDLLREDLGWDLALPENAELDDLLARLAREAPRDFGLSYEEFVLLAGRSFESLGRERLGGAGGGVQVLSVMQARARCFEHLFVLGLNRDVFPRAVREDPLLPDALRRELSAVLPELPIKATGYDEERYLFAQLLASSPHITLSWQDANDAGRARAASTFVERLRRDASDF
ncbi:MAG: hypothetical protein V3T07_06075, partial [Myxococcota bacterium]